MASDSMKRLWAPWRMAYIENEASPGCIFCDKPESDDRDVYIVKRGNHGFIMLNIFPYNNGHLLVAPYRHIAELGDLSEEERLEIMDLTTLGVDLLKETCHPDAFNVGANLGRVAGAGVADHLHFHIVPRWNGDTNFMPVLADVKVLPEALESVWEKLHEALASRELSR